MVLNMVKGMMASGVTVTDRRQIYIHFRSGSQLVIDREGNPSVNSLLESLRDWKFKDADRYYAFEGPEGQFHHFYVSDVERVEVRSG